MLPQLPPKTCILPLMFSSWRSADTSSIRCWVVFSISARCCVIIARTGRALAATALVEKHDAVSLRIEKSGGRAVAACARPAMHDDDGLPGERAVLLPIDPMLGKSRRSQMAGPDEGWVRRLVVWRGRLNACIHGNYICDK